LRHFRWTFHFTPTFASWLNAVESFFVWTQSADAILAKLDRFPVLSECV